MNKRDLDLIEFSLFARSIIEEWEIRSPEKRKEFAEMYMELLEFKNNELFKGDK